MQKIDAKYFQGYKPFKKQDKNSKKNKFIDILLADAPSRK